MLRKIGWSVLLGLFLLIPLTNADAAGIGAYFEYGDVSSGDIDADFGNFDYDEEHLGGGLTFDTNLAGDFLLNYRLDVGYQSVEQTFERRFGPDVEFSGNGVSINNALGFGILRNELMRLWIGPSLRFSVDVFNDNGADFVDYALAIGPEIGLNLHFSNALTLGLTTGYQYGFVWSVDDDANDTFDGNENLVFFNVSFFFRTEEDQFWG